MKGLKKRSYANNNQKEKEWFHTYIANTCMRYIHAHTIRKKNFQVKNCSKKQHII